MIHSIIESISRSIYTEFGDAYSICMEAKKQGLKALFFYILYQSHRQAVPESGLFQAEPILHPVFPRRQPARK